MGRLVAEGTFVALVVHVSVWAMMIHVFEVCAYRVSRMIPIAKIVTASA